MKTLWLHARQSDTLRKAQSGFHHLPFDSVPMSAVHSGPALLEQQHRTCYARTHIIYGGKASVVYCQQLTILGMSIFLNLSVWKIF